jgi:hypothetical protein
MRREPETRQQLQARQASLVAALLTGADPPADMDSEKIRVQAAVLIRKRGRAVARVRPELAAALGDDFYSAFHGYATGRSGPPPDCATADAREFARYLLRSRPHHSREMRRATRRLARVWPRLPWFGRRPTSRCRHSGKGVT